MKIEQNDIAWTLKNFERFGDTDSFPPSFELEYVLREKQYLMTAIQSLDEKYSFKQPERFYLPKPTIGFRATHQPDLIDNIILTSLLKGEFERIEQRRVPEELKIACSYRILAKEDGALFKSTSCWNNFNNRTMQEISSGAWSYVLIIDINDFFNQISHHRIQNNLELCGCEHGKTKIVENILNKFTGKNHSRGIPVGPIASTVLAELLMIDVDNYLLSRCISFTRYVDDYRIFCKTIDHAYAMLNIITEYLYTTHRLSINTGKSSIIEVQKLLDTIEDPEKMESDALAKTVNRLIFSVPYDEEIDEEHVMFVSLKSAIEDLFKIVKENKPLQLGLARHVLRRCCEKNISVISENVVDDLEKFIPVIKDAFIFIAKFKKAIGITRLHAKLCNLLENEYFGQLDILQYWILWLYFKIDSEVTTEMKSIVLSLVKNENLKTRYRILYAMQAGNIGFIRSLKESIDQYNPMSQRAILIAAKSLPKDECKHWVSDYRNTNDLKLNIIARSIYNNA